MGQLKVSPANKIAYGIGSVAFGIKGNGFDYFILLFYSQVMGVDAYLVSLALLIALLVDAFSDPLIGYFSDNTHHRWGVGTHLCMPPRYPSQCPTSSCGIPQRA